MKIKQEEKIMLRGSFGMDIFKIVNGRKIHIERYVDRNTIVNIGKQKLCLLLSNSGTGNYINSIGFGTGTAAPTVSDTTLTNTYLKNISTITYPSTTSVAFSWTLLTTENNGVSIAEYGLYSQNGTLFARKTRGIVAKASDILVNGVWTVSFI